MNTENNVWFETEQIETFVNNTNKDSGEMTADEMKACRKKLIVLHQCGENKEALIDQLKTMISGLECNYSWFAK